jgi:cytochrome c oxidase accessory protein FixG
MREQVCVYMCPWPRIQAALTDEWALNVTYRRDRGEPRTSLKKAQELHARGQPAGDCVDCNQCVAVCPTGIDIRDGAQLGCIMCGLCIDACDTVMVKVGRPTGLIAYDNDINIKRRLEAKPEIYRPLRPRTLAYAAIIVLVAGIMLYSVITRNLLGLSVVHDRNPLFVSLKDGSIRNGGTVRVLNKRNATRTYTLAVDGLPHAQVRVVGIDADPTGTPVITVGPDQTRELRVLLTVPADTKLGRSTPVSFRITDTISRETATAADHFIAE